MPEATPSGITKVHVTDPTGAAYVGAALEVPFSTTVPAAIATTDVGLYAWVGVHIVTQGGSSIVNFQASNDGINWVGVPLQTAGGATGSTVIATSTAAALYAGPVSYRYFRLNVTGIASGTTAGVIEFYPNARTHALALTQQTPSDGANGSLATTMAAFASVYNGASWDRMRSAVGAGQGNLAVGNQAATAGGWTTTRILSAATNNATSVKGSAGQVGGWHCYNANAAVRYVKLYNKATAPTVGTDPTVWVIPVPPLGNSEMEFTNGLVFATGIGLAIVTGVTDADNTAVAANEVIVNLAYK